jgi:tRNA(Ile)-lysidine synthase
VGESLLSHIDRVRPLISARRAETRAYCDEVGLSYVDDPSNEDPRFERAVVRQMVLGPIEDHWGDGAIRAMAKSIDRLGEDDAALEAQANILYAGMIDEDAPKDFDLPTFLNLPRALRRRLLELAVGPKRDRGAGIDEVLDALERDDRKPGASFDLAEKTAVVIPKDKLSVIDSSPS